MAAPPNERKRISVEPSFFMGALLNGKPISPAALFSSAVALAEPGGAALRLRDAAVRADAVLGVHAPEEALAVVRSGGIALHQDELVLPPERRAEVGTVRIE